jgi:hypothetical protein
VEQERGVCADDRAFCQPARTCPLGFENALGRSRRLFGKTNRAMVARSALLGCMPHDAIGRMARSRSLAPTKLAEKQPFFGWPATTPPRGLVMRVCGPRVDPRTDVLCQGGQNLRPRHWSPTSIRSWGIVVAQDPTALPQHNK